MELKVLHFRTGDWDICSANSIPHGPWIDSAGFMYHSEQAIRKSDPEPGREAISDRWTGPLTQWMVRARDLCSGQLANDCSIRNLGPFVRLRSTGQLQTKKWLTYRRDSFRIRICIHLAQHHRRC